ncbi:MAG: DUF2256 domain-containing protein [Pirellulales bacterium]
MKCHGNKSLLPSQNLVKACGRPFAWRKKWERDWPAIRYCSTACKRKKA